MILANWIKKVNYFMTRNRLVQGKGIQLTQKTDGVEISATAENTTMPAGAELAYCFIKKKLVVTIPTDVNQYYCRQAIDVEIAKYGDDLTNGRCYVADIVDNVSLNPKEQNVVVMILNIEKDIIPFWINKYPDAYHTAYKTHWMNWTTSGNPSQELRWTCQPYEKITLSHCYALLKEKKNYNTYIADIYMWGTTTGVGGTPDIKDQEVHVDIIGQNDDIPELGTSQAIFVATIVQKAPESFYFTIQPPYWR